MFRRVLVEKDIARHPRTNDILSRLRPPSVEFIERYDDIWGRVKKPYLQKRQTLDLFIAKKRGQLIKTAPEAYGETGSPHYYFIHAFNCLYECEYCYLQGYFHTPDLVLFINHEDILAEMTTILHTHRDQNDPSVWFHGGEFSDSLALSHLSGELPLYADFFKAHPKAKLEWRTKSANTKALRPLPPLPNVIVSYSLSPEQAAKEMDRKAPSLKARLKAIKEITSLGHPVAIHLDPIVHGPDPTASYGKLLDSLLAVLPPDRLAYLSLGVVRFSGPVFKQVEKNYPESTLLKQEFIKGFDGKRRYSRPRRGAILGQIKKLCMERGIGREKIYFCMEESPH